MIKYYMFAFSSLQESWKFLKKIDPAVYIF